MRWMVVLVFVALNAQAALCQTSAPAAPTRSVPSIVTDMIAAGRNAASDVYAIHQYGANLGMSPAEITRFDISYVKLAGGANGLLDAMAFSVQTNTVDAARIQAQAAALAQQGQDLDAALAQVQSRQQSTSSPTQFGLNIGDLLKTVVPFLSPVAGVVTQVLDYSSKSKATAQSDRQALANSIRQEYWPDVKTATAGGWPVATPAPSGAHT
jgi:hypothetical protein